MADSQISEYASKNKKSLRFDTCLDLFRSVALFISITRILAMIALIILISSNKQILFGLLMSDAKEEAFVKDIPKLFTVIVNGLLFTSVMINVVGIMGYARLSPYLLNLYGTCLFLELGYLMYIGLVSYTRDLNNYTWIGFYKNYKVSRPARHSVDVMQNTFHCCGTAYYKFEDLPLLPKSCCPAETLYEEWICLETFKYSKLCPLTSNNIYTALKEANVTPYLPYIAGGLTILTVGMGSLSYFIAYHLTKKDDED